MSVWASSIKTQSNCFCFRHFSLISIKAKCLFVRQKRSILWYRTLSTLWPNLVIFHTRCSIVSWSFFFLIQLFDFRDGCRLHLSSNSSSSFPPSVWTPNDDDWIGTASNASTLEYNTNKPWSVDWIHCSLISDYNTVIDCGRVPVILKGEVKYVNSSTFLDSIVNYTCSYGFRVSGVKTRVCKDDGKWSESSPKCEEIRCVPPEVPKNSSVVYSGNDRSTSESFKVGSTVQYRCSVGHIVRGESLRTCESHGSWSGDPPVCAFVDCGFPYVVANGRWLLTTNTTHYGSTVEYECVNNYKISGSARRLCLENGTWSSHAPVCEVINCGQPPVKDDKTLVEGNSFFVGEKVHYSCQYGYELVGEEIRICDSNAQWSHEIPHCRIVDCGRPPVLPNGRGYLLNSTTTYDSVIEYHCMSEFKLIGDPIRRCLATGSWSGSLPRCLEITLINEMSENDIDSRADSSQSILASGDRSSSSIHPQMENSRAMSIGISIGIAALLILIMVIGIVCLKTWVARPYIPFPILFLFFVHSQR